jgi:DNA-binding PucR family transcriptional regulator
MRCGSSAGSSTSWPPRWRSPRRRASSRRWTTASSSSPRRATARTTEIAEALRRRVQSVFPDHSFSAVVADRCSAPADYGPSFRLARRGLDAMVKLGKRGVVVDARELGIHGLLVEAADYDALRAHVSASLAPLLEDGVRGRELLATFDAYVASGFNQRETARRSYLHINTVANRLDRIGQRLDRDLSDPETLIELALALRLAKLVGLV